MARFSNLDDWLSWQETLHPKAIDLGLQRVKRVHARLGGLRPAPVVITVAGTNGKGSSVAMLDAMFRSAGYRTGVFTSPHLLRYNERICVDAVPQTDQQICDAFARVDTAREDVSLSYFEFGTLAALDIFCHQSLDVAILEVGLGGRLDAVNIIDPDIALVTSIGLDHTDWLGDDRDAIGREKAGIFRAGKPAVCADPSPPDSLRQVAEEVGADWLALRTDFTVSRARNSWTWHGPGLTLAGLPTPALAGEHQFNNAAGVIMAVRCLADTLPVAREAIEAGLGEVSLPARIQYLPGPLEQILDVSHNVQGAEVLAAVLAEQPFAGRTLAVLGMLEGKDCAGYVQALQGCVTHWYTVPLASGRAMSPAAMAACIETVSCGRSRPFDSMESARQQVFSDAQAGDRLLVCGSFFTVAEWLAFSSDNT